MKKKNKFYLIVSSDEIIMKDKNKYTVVTDQNRSKKIFDYYDIPDKYQKIVLKMNLKNNFSEARELFTNSKYTLNTPFFSILLSPGHNKTFRLESSDNIIDTKRCLYSLDSVKKFYSEIIDKGLAKDYLEALNQIYKYTNIEKETNKLRKIKRNEYIH